MIDTLDYLAIQQLIYRYAALLDRGTLEEAAALFDHSDFYVGNEATLLSRAGENRMEEVFRQWMSTFPEFGGVPCTRHVTTNLIITAAGTDTVCAESSVVIFQSGGTLPLQAVAAGTYNDRFEKVEGQWRFAERVLRPFTLN